MHGQVQADPSHRLAAGLPRQRDQHHHRDAGQGRPGDRRVGHHGVQDGRHIFNGCREGVCGQDQAVSAKGEGILQTFDHQISVHELLQSGPLLWLQVRKFHALVRDCIILNISFPGTCRLGM